MKHRPLQHNRLHLGDAKLRGRHLLVKKLNEIISVFKGDPTSSSLTTEDTSIVRFLVIPRSSFLVQFIC